MIPELLSKDHTILERRLMEFPPFGANTQGEKIYDISGALVRGKIEYLEEFVRKSSGPQAGAEAVDELCHLLNQRLRDPIFHVTPEFLNNIWHSYSYEFISYFRLFCSQLAGYPPQLSFQCSEGKTTSLDNRRPGQTLSHVADLPEVSLLRR